MTRILLIEDEDRIASFVEKGLRAAGYAVLRGATASEEAFAAELAVRDGRRQAHADINAWHAAQWAALGEALDADIERRLYGSGASAADANDGA